MLELIGKKIGMTHIFDDSGSLIPLTMIVLQDNCVVDLVKNDETGFASVSVGFSKVTNPKKISKAMAGFFNKKSLPIFLKIRTSKVSKDTQLKVGEQISFDSLIKKGDRVDICGVTIGKGFAGVMKRWNFRGLEASHGVSVSHRSHGSTGQRQDPGKVFKGKKMAGHLGVEKVTIKNLEVIIIDKEKSLIAVRGSVPGKSGSDLILKISNS